MPSTSANLTMNIDTTGSTGVNESQIDLEQGIDTYLYNDSVSSLSWSGCTVTVLDRTTKQERNLLEAVSGVAKAGEMLALMGPSGSGKTTLLNLIAGRTVGKTVKVEVSKHVNGTPLSSTAFRALSSYVEQEDALVGSLTVSETFHFAARMASDKLSDKTSRDRIVTTLLASFGLTASAGTIVGTPVQKGISGGQKRRLSTAVGVISAPKILLLDEPTSGLDSTSSKEVMSFMKDVARRFKLIVICSIHQPSTATFNLFDQVMLLSKGMTTYFGPVAGLDAYLTSIGHPMPLHINPAEYVLDLVNTDFSHHSAAEGVDFSMLWAQSKEARDCELKVAQAHYQGRKEGWLDSLPSGKTYKPNATKMLAVLLHRAFIKSYRDVVVYWVRVIMYAGLAILMGTVWLRLDANQQSIQPFINSIFFGAAFLSFMAVAYVPAYLEDLAVFAKDHANGLYGPSLFIIANFCMGLPYLFLITILFSVISYWLTGFQSSATAFFTFVMWVFLDLVAAESLVVFLSSIMPNFVVSLALVAFANGLWMSVGGFLVPMNILNDFYKYVFHYIDYQAYVFQGMMVNEFKDRTYQCATGCQCNYPTGELQCEIPGRSVLRQYDYATGKIGEWVGILLAIILVYRLLAYCVVWIKGRK